ncbi:hypothetical protein RFI_27161, partial [Reticulomyxa filosa]
NLVCLFKQQVEEGSPIYSMQLVTSYRSENMKIGRAPNLFCKTSRGLIIISSHDMYKTLKCSNFDLSSLPPDHQKDYYVEQQKLYQKTKHQQEIELNTTPKIPERSEQEIEQLIQKMRQGLEVKNRKWWLRMYRNCWIGSDAVKWMLDNKQELHIENEDEALALGNMLLEKHKIQHATQQQPQHRFTNAYSFYQFVNDCEDCDIVKCQQSILTWDDSRLYTVAQEIYDHVEIKDRLYHLRPYVQCFLGAEVVHFLVQYGHAFTIRQDNNIYIYVYIEAVAIGRRLMKRKIIAHVTKGHDFENDEQLYRFVSLKFAQQHSKKAMSSSSLDKLPVTPLDRSLYNNHVVMKMKVDNSFQVFFKTGSRPEFSDHLIPTWFAQNRYGDESVTSQRSADARSATSTPVFSKKPHKNSVTILNSKKKSLLSQKSSNSEHVDDTLTHKLSMSSFSSSPPVSPLTPLHTKLFLFILSVRLYIIKKSKKKKQESRSHELVGAKSTPTFRALEKVEYEGGNGNENENENEEKHASDDKTQNNKKRRGNTLISVRSASVKSNHKTDSPQDSITAIQFLTDDFNNNNVFAIGNNNNIVNKSFSPPLTVESLGSFDGSLSNDHKTTPAAPPPTCHSPSKKPSIVLCPQQEYSKLTCFRTKKKKVHNIIVHVYTIHVYVHINK